MSGSARRDNSLTRTDYRAFETGQLDTLTRIATDLRSQAVSVHDFPDVHDEQTRADDPRLDPSKPEFDHYVWAEKVLSSMNRSDISFERQGVVFSDLCVSGSGSSLQFQETVLSSLLTPFRWPPGLCQAPAPLVVDAFFANSTVC